MVVKDNGMFVVPIQKNHIFAAHKGNSQHGGYATWRKISTKSGSFSSGASIESWHFLDLLCFFYLC